jgi:hypothetical protein
MLKRLIGKVFSNNELADKPVVDAAAAQDSTELSKIFATPVSGSCGAPETGPGFLILFAAHKRSLVLSEFSRTKVTGISRIGMPQTRSSARIQRVGFAV